MKCSVIVPVYNEQSTIIEIIRKIKEVQIDKEIIIVDDGSTDGTDKLLGDRFGNDNEIKIVYLNKNYGKGFAIREAIKHVNGDIVIMQDADLEYDPQDYKKLIAPIEEGCVSIVYGSRFMDLNKFSYICNWLSSKLRGIECKTGHLYFSNFICIQILNFMVRVLYGAKITDEATCYKVFKADVLKNLNLTAIGFEFCPEITAKVCKAGHRIYELPISYYPRGVEHGKKVNWKDGLIAIAMLLKYRFVN